MLGNSLFKKISSMPLEEQRNVLKNLTTSKTWYGGRVFTLPNYKGTLSFDQVVDIASKSYKDSNQVEKLEAINKIWSLNMEKIKKIESNLKFFSMILINKNEDASNLIRKFGKNPDEGADLTGLDATLITTLIKGWFKK